LRTGLVTVYEGDTISYAVDPTGKPITDARDLSPFTPFAWSTEESTVPRPFILYWNRPPRANPEQRVPGSIVLHGGFTSAFYEFGDEEKAPGTGRLIESIACWLAHLEERIYLEEHWCVPIPKGIPELTGRYEPVRPFRDWRQPRLHLVLLLDLSESMEGCIIAFISKVNEFIRKHAGKNTIFSAITFNNVATLVSRPPTAPVPAFTERNCKSGTNYQAALQKAVEVIEDTDWSYESRIIMVTDGEPVRDPDDEIRRIHSNGIRLDAIFLRTDLATFYNVSGQGTDRTIVAELLEQHRGLSDSSRASLAKLVTWGGKLQEGFVDDLVEMLDRAATSE
jgi:uncharacterized protein YegL